MLTLDNFFLSSSVLSQAYSKLIVYTFQGCSTDRIENTYMMHFLNGVKCGILFVGDCED